MLTGLPEAIKKHLEALLALENRVVERRARRRRQLRLRRRVRRFHEDFGPAVNRRSTVIILGDGRGNGNDAGVEAFAEITRRARETIWLTPEPRYSWGLGGCDLPVYAEYCSRVRVVRDLTGLESAAEEMATELVGR